MRWGWGPSYSHLTGLCTPWLKQKNHPWLVIDSLIVLFYDPIKKQYCSIKYLVIFQTNDILMPQSLIRVYKKIFFPSGLTSNRTRISFIKGQGGRSYGIWCTAQLIPIVHEAQSKYKNSSEELFCSVEQVHWSPSSINRLQQVSLNILQ